MFVNFMILKKSRLPLHFETDFVVPSVTMDWKHEQELAPFGCVKKITCIWASCRFITTYTNCKVLASERESFVCTSNVVLATPFGYQ